MPSIIASDGSRPGPKPNIARPCAWWSSWTTRSATVSGLWYGSEMTPVPSRMRLVRSIAAAMNSSGEEMSSTPPEWCSPIQASANPMRSRYSTVSSWPRIARVGSMSRGSSHGGMKAPSRRASRSTAVGVVIGGP